jgi:DNA-binding LytR/AlgR family response regulator
VIFFFLVAGFLLLLLLEQGVTLAREARQRRIEEARANRLELALEQVRQSDEASELSVKSAGKMERISTANIVQCRGAGGYSEIILSDGRELLHSATLAEMEDALPATFIRVHRSHLVNTSFIKTLNRDTSGTGTLILSDGAEVAVSRRIMPSVRQALG